MASIDDCRNRVGFQPATRTELNEHRSGIVPGRILDVKFEGDFALATVETHFIDNGALSHPSSGGRVLFARQGSQWRHVYGHQHPAWALFKE